MSAGTPAPIRLLHFADLHLGLERFGARMGAAGLSAHAQDTLRSLDELIADARAQPPDLILFGGDAFKSPQPEPTLQRAFAERVLALAKIAPLVLLVGRHDTPQQAERASSLAIFATLAVPRVLVAADSAIHHIDTARGPLTLATAPYDFRRADSAANIQALAREAEQGNAPRVLRPQSAVTRVLLAHLILTEAQGGDEDSLDDATLPLAEIAAPCWDYVALGGVHRHQQLGEANVAPIVYPGSLERLDFSAADEEKGYIRAEIQRGKADWRFRPVAARRFLRISADLREASEPLTAFRDAITEQEVSGAIVRAELRLTREQDAALPERALRQLLRVAGAEHVAASQRELSGPIAARLTESDGGPADLLTRYLELRGETRGKAFSAAEREALLAAAQEIWAEVETEE